MPGLYIHIPFCRRKCFYCDFVSVKYDESLADRHMEALNIHSREFEGEKVDTIYIGGGTPSVLSIEQIERALVLIKERFDLSVLKEWTFEANSESLTLEKLNLLKAGGVDRLSLGLGLQAYNDEDLRALGRVHTFNMFEQAFHEARNAGFDNINVDLIYGIPNQTLESWIKSLDILSGFNCEHISLYPLTIEEGTIFYQNHVKTDDDLQRDMYECACEFLDKRGYRHYEISNWAYLGKEAVHNSAYWRNEEYIGLGAGAAGYWKRKRYKNYEDVNLYIRALQEAQSPLSEMERIDDEIYACERIMLGLRLIDEGIKAESFEGKHRDILDKLLEQKVVEQKDGMIKIAQEYVFTVNAIVSEFMK